jgi:hypothetical protein
MKEGRSSDSVEYITYESGDDVEEHGDQDKLSNFNEPESDHRSRVGLLVCALFSYETGLTAESIYVFAHRDLGNSEAMREIHDLFATKIYARVNNA